jgi:hypothetical protein
VIRHVAFDEVWRAAGMSHLHLGMESLLLLVLASAYGTFTSTQTYLFFFLSAWLFTISLLLSTTWFNPLAFDWPSLKADWLEWHAWVHAQPKGAGVKPGVEGSWIAWYKRDVQGPYLSATLSTRVWRTLRVSRLVLLAALLIMRVTRPDGVALALAFFLAFAFGTLIAYEVAHLLTSACPRRTQPPTWCCPLRAPAQTAGSAAAVGAGVAGVLLLGSLGVVKSDGRSILTSLSAFFVLLAWAGRVCNIVSVWPLKHGTRSVHKLIDCLTGGLVLSLSTLMAAFCPLGGALHNRMLFSSRYGDTVEVITGVRDALERLDKNAGVRYLKVDHLGAPAFTRAPAGGADASELTMENRIGVREFRLKKLAKLGSPMAAAGSAAGGGGTGLLASTLPVTAAPAEVPVGGFGGMGIGGFGGVAASEPVAALATAPLSGSAPITYAAGADRGPHVKRTVQEILQEARAAAVAARPPPGPIDARSSSAQPRGGAAGHSRKRGSDGSGGGSVRSASSGGSVSALRSKFEANGKAKGHKHRRARSP